jgi:hypothetical protein
MYLLYIALAFPSMVFYARATRGPDLGSQLVRIAEHRADMRIAVVLTMLTAIVAFALAIGLFGITRSQDLELAVFALCCRVGEGVINAIAAVGMLALLSIAMTGVDALDPASARGAAAALMRQNWGWFGAFLFAVGSTAFCWLLLRGRIVPAALAWLGVLASLILDVGLPLQIGGLASGASTQLMWIPMALFEIPVGIWFLLKGVSERSAENNKLASL